MVQNHVYELQNKELEINLNLREKLNQILSNQLQDVKRELEMNLIELDSDDEKEDEMVREYNRLRSARRMAHSPTPSSKGRIQYPPISAKRGPMSFSSKTKEVSRLKKMNTSERLPPYPPIYEGSYDAERGRGDSHRKQNRYGLGIRAESIDPLKVIQVKGSNYLNKLPPYKQGLRSSNSPSRPNYKKEELVKVSTPAFGRGRGGNNRSQEGQEMMPSIPTLGVQGAGINVRSKPQVIFCKSRARVEDPSLLLTSSDKASNQPTTTDDRHSLSHCIN